MHVGSCSVPPVNPAPVFSPNPSADGLLWQLLLSLLRKPLGGMPGILFPAPLSPVAASQN